MKMLLIFLVLITSAYAKKGPNPFEQTAAKYEKKARSAKKAGLNDLYSIYSKMAGIKREAAKIHEKGTVSSMNWDSYHELEGRAFELEMKYRSRSLKKK